jgi:hypothetical protein
MGSVLKMGKKRPDIARLKSIGELQVGDHIGLPVGEHKVYAQVVSIPHPTKPLIVYRILGAESVGVVNMKRSQVFKVMEQSPAWVDGYENVKDEDFRDDENEDDEQD